MLTCEKYCHKICLPSRYANSLFQPEWVHLPHYVPLPPLLLIPKRSSQAFIEKIIKKKTGN
jgi:hypothetical protein